jgi:hypothetical protein
MESIPPGDVISYDHTYNIRNRTYEGSVSIPESHDKEHLPIEGGYYKANANAMLIAMNRRGQVLAHKCTVESKKEDTIALLSNIKKRCDKNQWTYPKYVVVDDCCSSRNTINKVFPEANVRQDMKHLINRILECTSKVRTIRYFCLYYRPFYNNVSCRHIHYTASSQRKFMALLLMAIKRMQEVVTGKCMRLQML